MNFPPNTTVTLASQKRIERFIDWFIRSDYVQNWTAENDDDFVNYPDRANRCYEAAKNGCDGKTHAEVIADWRHAFDAFIRYAAGRFPMRNCPFRIRHNSFRSLERFTDAVTAYFDSVETWHEQNGSLNQEIG